MSGSLGLKNNGRSDVLRIALIGCGAVVIKSHVPAILDMSGVTVAAVVDLDLDQAQACAEIVGAEQACCNVSQIDRDFDLAIVATPSATHFQLTKELLSSGQHVLVEKPLALTHPEATELAELAESKQLILAAGLVRRYSRHFRALDSILRSQMLGVINSFKVSEGGVFSWPVQSPSFFTKKVAGGGVLADHGAHLLDACLWWFGDYRSVEYQDDSRGGVEAECHLNLQMTSGVTGTVTMSRLRTLANAVQIKGEKADLDMCLSTGDMVISPANGRSMTLNVKPEERQSSAPQTTEQLFTTQLQKVADSIRRGEAVDDLVLGAHSLPSIRLIEECYQQQGKREYDSWA